MHFVIDVHVAANALAEQARCAQIMTEELKANAAKKAKLAAEIDAAVAGLFVVMSVSADTLQSTS